MVTEQKDIFPVCTEYSFMVTIIIRGFKIINSVCKTAYLFHENTDVDVTDLFSM